MNGELHGIAPQWTAGGVDAAAEPELAALAALHAAGLPVAPLLWVPAEAEEAFYRLNGLPARLRGMLAPLASFDPDEDDVEELAPIARRTVEADVLLDTWVDAFLDALEAGPAPVTVRRTEGHDAAPTRPETVSAPRAALLALRRVWAADWEVEAVLWRCQRFGSAEVRPRGVVLHAPAAGRAGAELAGGVAAHAPGAEADVDAEGRIVRLRWKASAERPAAPTPAG